MTTIPLERRERVCHVCGDGVFVRGEAAAFTPRRRLTLRGRLLSAGHVKQGYAYECGYPLALAVSRAGGPDQAFFIQLVGGLDMDAMAWFKAYLRRHFEPMFVLALLMTAVISYFVPQKLAFLNFYFLPIIVGGYYLGQRDAVLGAVLSVLCMVAYAVIDPHSFTTEIHQYEVFQYLLVWGGFLILAGAMIGHLRDRLFKRIQQDRIDQQRMEKLIDLSIALSMETQPVPLLERILESAKELSHADGGTLYSVANDTVKIEILRNDTLAMRVGGSAAPSDALPTIPLFKADGSPNLNNVVTYAIQTNSTVNIPDSYDTDNFDFSGTRRFDAQTGYRSTSFLTVPLRNHENQIIGALQLINAMDPRSSRVVPFNALTQRLIEALASQAAISLTKDQLIQDIKRLFESLIHLIADSIDKKSPYTGGHCRRVPALTMLLAEAANEEREGPLADFHMTDRDRYELEIAGWLHDCGKIITPVHVVDKATKLETIYDRIHLVDSRFEILKRDAEIDCLKRQLAALGVMELEPSLQQALQSSYVELDEQREFLRRCNTGGEFMTEQDQERVRSIARRTWLSDGKPTLLLSDNETYNLTISRGTLTTEERKVINDHIRDTIAMLQSLPFPKHLRNVPEYAGGHHERMDGKGYPNGLTREQMSVQARILGIADIFEALTACDRPYKSAKTLSETLKIMAHMKKDGHIDPDLFDIFIRRQVYLQYAERFLDPEQIDDVDIDKLLAGS